MKVSEIKRLELGVQGENLSRTITIDCSEWYNEFPEGIVNIILKQPTQTTLYVAATTYTDGTLTFSPTSSDTNYAGIGKAEIRLTIGSIIKKSISVPSIINPSITGVSYTLPQAYQSYIEQLTAAAQTITQNISSLSTSISNEATARQSADTTLQTNINTEASSRASADNSIRSDMATAHATLNASLSALNTLIEQVRAIAEGKRNTYTITYASNPSFNSNEDEIDAVSFVDVYGSTIQVSSLHDGDNILVKETGVPDRWYSNNKFYTLETTKIDLEAIYSAENTRIANENTRQANEQTRQTQETSREQQSALDHSQSESDHSTYTTDHNKVKDFIGAKSLTLAEYNALETKEDIFYFVKE